MDSNNYRSGMRLSVATEGNDTYDICLNDSFSGLEDELKKIGCTGRRICIVTDSNVAPLYLDELKAIILNVASKVSVYIFDAGEENKTLDSVRGLYEVLIQSEFDRKDYLVALGGGVVGDLTGFAAATYLRGISFIQVPTTLLAQIDSSIGGKTGVDFDSFKNMVGAFHQPKLVYSNTQTLQTLPEEQFASGMGEALKHGLIADKSYFDWMKDQKKEIVDRNSSVLPALVGRSCEIKRSIVQKDPKEITGERALLNFGHTIGHAIEKLENFELLHGQCVALGSVAAAYISCERNMITEQDFQDIRNVFAEYGLPISFNGHSAEEVVATTKKDKKMDAGTIRFVLLDHIGEAVVTYDVTEKEMVNSVRFLQK